MKQIIIFTMLLILSATSFSQQSNPSPTLTKQDYLQKSKHQNTAAWLLLIGGTIMIIRGTYAYLVIGSFTTSLGIGLVSVAAAFHFLSFRPKTKEKLWPCQHLSKWKIQMLLKGTAWCITRTLRFQ